MLTIRVQRTMQDDGLVVQLLLKAIPTAGEDAYIFVVDRSEGTEFVGVASAADLITLPIEAAAPTPPAEPTPTFPEPTPTSLDVRQYVRVSSIMLFFNDPKTADQALERILDDVKINAQIQAIDTGSTDTFTAYFHQSLPSVDSDEARVREYLTRTRIGPKFRRDDPSYTNGRLSIHKRNTQANLKLPPDDNPYCRGIQ